MKRPLFTLLFFIVTLINSVAQPGPGDVFREYIWLPEMVKEQGKFLRVGGKLDYKSNDSHYPADRHSNGYIPFHHPIDLTFAVKAEIMVEKIASHDDTKGLRISWNNNTYHTFPASDSIPPPESAYMHHTNPVVTIPLSELSEGLENTFRLEVDTTQRWDWPQNLIYGLILRVYYSADSLKDYTNSEVEVQETSPTHMRLGISNPDSPIRKADFLGYFNGLNYEGDGKYMQWHYRFLRGKIQHHLGSTENYPYMHQWNTEWVPDQTRPMKVAARITYHNGLIYFTDAKSIDLPDRPFEVYLIKPYNQPQNWVTREAEFSEYLNIPVEPDKIKEARLIWTSWSSCYNQGIRINEHLLEKIDGPCYEYADHDISFDPAFLIKGENELTTLKEPLHNGQMVHGMEVQYPGISMLIKTKTVNTN